MAKKTKTPTLHAQEDLVHAIDTRVARIDKQLHDGLKHVNDRVHRLTSEVRMDLDDHDKSIEDLKAIGRADDNIITGHKAVLDNHAGLIRNLSQRLTTLEQMVGKLELASLPKPVVLAWQDEQHVIHRIPYKHLQDAIDKGVQLGCTFKIER